MTPIIRSSDAVATALLGSQKHLNYQPQLDAFRVDSCVSKPSEELRGIYINSRFY